MEKRNETSIILAMALRIMYCIDYLRLKFRSLYKVTVVAAQNNCFKFKRFEQKVPGIFIYFGKYYKLFNNQSSTNNTEMFETRINI